MTGRCSVLIGKTLTALRHSDENGGDVWGHIMKRVTAFTGLALAMAGAAHAQAGDQERISDPAVERALYEQFEPIIRADYEDALAKMKAATLAGGKEWSAAATDGVRVLTYFKAVSYAACAVSALDGNTNTSGRLRYNPEKFEVCAKSANNEILKFTNLSDYRHALGADFVRCEVKARQFERESNMKPFGFLRLQTTSATHRVYDFAEFNRCIQSKF